MKTKFVDRVAAAFGFSRMIEAVNHRSEERGWVYAQAQDSKVDLSSYDRTRLMALSRKCFYNNAIVRGAVRDKAMYSVGSGIGIRPQAMSGDQAWDDAAEQWWENWARSPEISGRHDMRSLQMLVSEAIDRDGEIFAVLTAKSDGAPAVQIVESHRIESPDTAAGNNGVVDGVKLDKFQRPLGYFIGEGDEYPRRHREIKADVMLHVYEPERSDQVRGYPAIGVALNSVLDRDELLRFEMMAAKAGSSIGLVIKNSTGNIGAEGFLGDFSKDSNGNLTRESIFGGGLVPRMKNSEDIQSFVMNRPNEKLDKHLEQYIRAAAIGLGLPYEFVWDTSAIGGVAQRFIIQKAARCFAARQDVLVNAFLSKLWRYAIARAISRRELPMVAGWQQVGWQTPRSITVDVGREATARRDDVKAGLMTLSDFFGEQGIDWKEAVAEIAAEREFAADLGVMIGVEQAQPQEEIIPDIAQPEVVMPAAEFSQLIAKLDCGTGAGGFKPGNDCAKGGKVNPEDDSADNYRGGHKPPNPENGAPLHDLTGSGAFPEDIYGKDASKIYSSADEKLDQQTLKIFRDVKGKPNAELTIYRAVPVNVSDTTINAGDWVSVNLEYAKMHGEGALAGEYKLLKGTARASELYTNADSIQEQGYWPSGSGKMSIVAEEIRFSARARKKKRIYKRKKPEAASTP
jgi:lambda family phage portal protein